MLSSSSIRFSLRFFLLQRSSSTAGSGNELIYVEEERERERRYGGNYVRDRCVGGSTQPI
jgi:hypothetical protein